MRDFEGIHELTDDTKMNLMNFSFHLTVGNLDDAYRSVQNIKSSAVWMSMAQMCVKTRRLNVAEICVSNLSNALGTSSRMGLTMSSKDKETSEKHGHTMKVSLALWKGSP